MRYTFTVVFTGVALAVHAGNAPAPQASTPKSTAPLQLSALPAAQVTEYQSLTPREASPAAPAAEKPRPLVRWVAKRVQRRVNRMGEKPRRDRDPADGPGLLDPARSGLWLVVALLLVAIPVTILFALGTFGLYVFIAVMVLLVAVVVLWLTGVI